MLMSGKDVCETSRSWHRSYVKMKRPYGLHTKLPSGSASQTSRGL